MDNLDLRLENQRVNGFYVWKEQGGYSVGKNGTSIHTFINKSENTKEDILDFISSNL